jgi:predicted nucleic acid-binding protein
MAIEPLSALPDGCDVFIDANIFVYGLDRKSNQCFDLLQRCAREDVIGVTSFEVLSEVTHWLMIIEAVAAHQIPKPDWKLLKRDPSIVRQLRHYWSRVETILNLNFLVLDLEESIFRQSRSVREMHGLLTNDSLIIATMEEYGLEFLASNDNDFGSIPTVTVFKPTDGP